MVRGFEVCIWGFLEEAIRNWPLKQICVLYGLGFRGLAFRGIVATFEQD